MLGYAGLLPFLGASAAMFSADPVTSGVGLYVLSLYAVVILAFMGAVHWGLALARPGPSVRLQLGLSVLPALAGWAALAALPPRSALVAIGGAFAVLLAADLIAVRGGLAPHWYGRLRVPLTVVVCGALWTAAWTLGR